MSKCNHQKMFEMISNWQQSGLSQKAWCEQANIAYSSFHYWYRRYRMTQAASCEDAPEGFVQVLVQDKAFNTPWCELVFDNGNRLFLHQPVSAVFIKSLLD